MDRLDAGVFPSEEHILVLDAYRRASGIPTTLPVSAAAVIRAVAWWNDRGRHLPRKVHQLEEMPVVPMALVVPAQDMTEAYWTVLDAFRRSRGLPPWRERRDRAILTAAEVNEAVEWWNRYYPQGPRDDVPSAPHAPTED